MAHNQEMVTKRKDWEGKVRIMGFSIDQDQPKLRSHVADKGWGDVEHYWVRNGNTTCDKDFGVKGVPHFVLIDTKGKIAFIGHPSSIPLEATIDKLLKGEELEGKKKEGDGGEDEGGEKGALPENKDELVKTFMSSVDTFKEDADFKA